MGRPLVHCFVEDDMDCDGMNVIYIAYDGEVQDGCLTECFDPEDRIKLDELQEHGIVELMEGIFEYPEGEKESVIDLLITQDIVFSRRLKNLLKDRC